MECHVFQLPRCKITAHRRAKAEVRGASPRGSAISDVDHVVTVASRPVKAAVPVQVRLVNPILNRAQDEETNRRSAKPIHPVQVRGARPFSISPVAQAARASDFDSEGDGASPSGAAIFISRRSPMQRQRAQTSFSAGASPAAGTKFPSDPKLRQRSSRLLTGGAGRTSLRVHQTFCGSEAGVTS